MITCVVSSGALSFWMKSVKLPITVQYETPETLGKDRLAAAVGANYLEPGKDLLVIDAGTAITYELIEASGAYLGGNISPGMTTRFKALNFYTKKLPLVTEQEEVPLLGTNTRECYPGRSSEWDSLRDGRVYREVTDKIS